MIIRKSLSSFDHFSCKLLPTNGLLLHLKVLLILKIWVLCYFRSSSDDHLLADLSWISISVIFIDHDYIFDFFFRELNQSTFPPIFVQHIISLHLNKLSIRVLWQSFWSLAILFDIIVLHVTFKIVSDLPKLLIIFSTVKQLWCLIVVWAVFLRFTRRLHLIILSL